MLKNRITRPVAGNQQAEPSAARPPMPADALKLRAQSMVSVLSSASAGKRIVVFVVVVVAIIISVSAVRHLLKAPSTHQPDAQPVSTELQEEINRLIANRPDLSLQAEQTGTARTQAEKVAAWPGMEMDGIDPVYGDNECTISFYADLFHQNTSLREEGAATVASLLKKHGATLKDYQVIVSGRSLPNYQETAGSAMADYSLRLKRAQVIRNLLLVGDHLDPANVLVTADEESDGGSKSVVIRLRPKD